MTKRPLVDEAADPETPFRRILQLSQIDDVKVRRALVDNPIRNLVRQGVAKNPSTPLDVLRSLASEKSEPSPDVRKSAEEALDKRGMREPAST